MNTTTVRMVFALHFLPRGRIMDLQSRAADLASTIPNLATETGAIEEPSGPRVVEMFSPGSKEAVADLSLEKRELPEVLTAMHAADEIHVHGVDLSLALHMLPYVRPEALEGKTLVLRGPCISPEFALESDIARLSAWPGQVLYDRAARCSLSLDLKPEACFDRALHSLNPYDHALIPSAAKPKPRCELSAGTGEEIYVVEIALSRDIPKEIAAFLKSGDVHTALGPSTRGLRVVSEHGDTESEMPAVLMWVDERDTEALAARARRRSVQCVFAWGWHDALCIEAVLQGLPVVVLGTSHPRSQAMEKFWHAEPAALGLPIVDAIEPARIADALRVHLRRFAEYWKRGLEVPGTNHLRDWLMRNSECVSIAPK